MRLEPVHVALAKLMSFKWEGKHLDNYGRPRFPGAIWKAYDHAADSEKAMKRGRNASYTAVELHQNCDRELLVFSSTPSVPKGIVVAADESMRMRNSSTMFTVHCPPTTRNRTRSKYLNVMNGTVFDVECQMTEEGMLEIIILDCLVFCGYNIRQLEYRNRLNKANMLVTLGIIVPKTGVAIRVARVQPAVKLAKGFGSEVDGVLLMPPRMAPMGAILGGMSSTPSTSLPKPLANFTAGCTLATLIATPVFGTIIPSVTNMFALFRRFRYSSCRIL